MNLIDIASHQDGIDLAVMFRKNEDLDGVIVKVSEATGYVNPCAKGWLDWLVSHGKPAGTYHYLNMAGAEAEAQHYVASVQPWLGKVALAIDYEETAVLAKGPGYLKACLDEVYRLTGVKPFVYCSQSVIGQHGFDAIAAAGYPLWVAQYADYKTVNGFLANPWHSGRPSPFADFTMRQYTSCGRLPGWLRNLDFDKFYGTADDWHRLTQMSGSDPEPEGVKGPNPQVIEEILDGKFGSGQERVQSLTAAGYDAEACQRKVNELYAIALSCRKKAAGNEEYLSSICQIMEVL